MTHRSNANIGIADIVLLMDATASGHRHLWPVASNIEHFFDHLTRFDHSSDAPIRDYRIRLVAYRDRDFDGEHWWTDTTFESSAARVKTCVQELEFYGGGDEPQSMLDALYRIAQWRSTAEGAPALATHWRHHNDSTRVVIIFTPNSCRQTFTADDGYMGTVSDVITACSTASINVMLFAPEAPCYLDLVTMPGMEWEPVGRQGDPHQTAFADFFVNPDAFTTLARKVRKLCHRADHSAQ